MVICGIECEVFSRIVGYFRPVKNWNKGKAEEFKQRVVYDARKSLASEFVEPAVKSERATAREQ